MPGQGHRPWRLRGQRCHPAAGSPPLGGQGSGRSPPTGRTCGLCVLSSPPSLPPANRGPMEDPGSLTGLETRLRCARPCVTAGPGCSLSCPPVGEQGPLEGAVGTSQASHLSPRAGTAQAPVTLMGRKCFGDSPSLQTLSAHVDKPPSSAGGQKHQAVVTGSDVTLGEQSRWDWGHCIGGQLLTGRGWAQGRGPGGAGLLRASGAGTCWLRALTPRPPATPSSSARHFLTLGAGTREPARLGLVLLSQEGG